MLTLAACKLGAAGRSDGAATGTGADGAACAGDTRTEEVTFPSLHDGLVLHATAVQPCTTGDGGARRPVVVFAHQLCRDRSEWQQPSHDWIAAFTARGVGSLAVDLRGHGASTAWPGDGGTHDLCAEANDPNAMPLYAAMVDDVAAAVAYARGAMHATHVALVGASVGANAALTAFATDADLSTVVALSPGLDDRGITTIGPIERIARRPALLEASDGDTRSADAVRALKGRNQNAQIVVWMCAAQVTVCDGHGNLIIDQHPDELPRVVNLVTSLLGI